VRFSLRTREPAEAKIKQGRAIAHLETTWRKLRSKPAPAAPVLLTDREAHALAGDLYLAWAGEEAARCARSRRPERTWSATQNLTKGKFEIDRPHGATAEEAAERADEEEEAFACAADHFSDPELTTALDPLIDRLLLAKGIAALDPECRPMVLNAFRMALRDAFEHRQRNAAGDYAPDPKADRFPEWNRPEASLKPAAVPPPQSLTGLVDGWWKEAKPAGRKASTYESYRSTVAKPAAFLGHNDAAGVTRQDVLNFPRAAPRRAQLQGPPHRLGCSPKGGE
jgi:hypothetical protein